jgi:hypothetical protein
VAVILYQIAPTDRCYSNFGWTHEKLPASLADPDRSVHAPITVREAQALTDAHAFAGTPPPPGSNFIFVFDIFAFLAVRSELSELLSLLACDCQLMPFEIEGSHWTLVRARRRLDPPMEANMTSFELEVELDHLSPDHDGIVLVQSYSSIPHLVVDTSQPHGSGQRLLDLLPTTDELALVSVGRRD